MSVVGRQIGTNQGEAYLPNLIRARRELGKKITKNLSANANKTLFDINL